MNILAPSILSADFCEFTNIIHVDGSVDPARDIETINLELIFSDVEILDRRIAKIAKQARMDKTLAKELELVEAVKAHLEDGKMARSFEVPDDEDAQLWFKGYNLLTAKPTIYAANVSEDDLADDGASNPHVAKVREMAKEEGAEVFVICAQIEQELADLDEDEKKEYLEDLGVESSGLDKLVAASYSLLGLISFLTAGEDECRAWTIKKGTKAPQAAGKIHTDFERGFIKAEVVNYQDLLDNGTIYGGVIGGFATLFIYSYTKKINPFKIGDCAVFGLVIGQIVGRWGNFFNREVFGGYTDSLFAMRLPVDAVRASDIKQTHLDGMAAMGDVNFIQVHPTFLYEGVWNLCLLIAMFVFRKHKNMMDRCA